MRMMRQTVSSAATVQMEHVEKGPGGDDDKEDEERRCGMTEHEKYYDQYVSQPSALDSRGGIVE